MNSASRHSLITPLLVAFGLLSATGCAMDAGEDPSLGHPSLGHQEQAVVANADTVVQSAPQLAKVRVIAAPIEPDKRPVVVLSAPVTTNGGGVGQGGSDEGPRPNPWTPPPETKSDDDKGGAGGTGAGGTGGTGGTGTGTNAPDVEGAAGGTKSAPTK